MKEQHIVFFCGPDRCGKSEMSKELSKRLGLPYYKASTEHSGFVSNQDRFILDIRYSCPARLDLLKQIGTGIVYDRGYPCEWVYSRFFNRQTDESAIWWLDDQYANLGAKIIIPVRRSYTGIVDDLNPSIDEIKLSELTSLYGEFSKKTKCEVLELYVDDENLERELIDIMSFLDKR